MLPEVRAELFARHRPLARRVVGLFDGAERFGVDVLELASQRRRHHRMDDEVVRQLLRAPDLLFVEQLFPELLAHLRADDLDADLVRIVPVHWRQLLDHHVREVLDPEDLHLGHEDLTALRQKDRVHRQLHGFAQRHDETRHIEVGDRDRPSVMYLAVEERNHRAPGPENVAEARRSEDRSRVAPPKVGRGEEAFSHQLRSAHDRGRVHRLVRRGQNDALDAVRLGGVHDVLRAEHVGLNRVTRGLLAQMHVLERRRVQDRIDALHDTLQPGGVPYVAERERDERVEVARLLLQEEKLALVIVDPDDLGRGLRNELTQDLATYGAADACDENSAAGPVAHQSIPEGTMRSRAGARTGRRPETKKPSQYSTTSHRTDQTLSTSFVSTRSSSSHEPPD